MSTPEERLARATIAVAIAPPLKQNEYAHAALIPWTRIHELRAALENVGIDWKALKR